MLRHVTDCMLGMVMWMYLCVLLGVESFAELDLTSFVSWGFVPCVRSSVGIGYWVSGPCVGLVCEMA